MRRAQRHGLAERLLSAVYVYPFRCQLCGHRFRTLQWGVRYVPRDRRKYERVRASLPVTLVSADGTRTGVLTDLSLGGAGLTTDASFAAGEQLTLTIQSTGGQTSVAVDLVVVRSAGAQRLGLQFLHVDETERERLGRLVQELIRGRPPIPR